MTHFHTAPMSRIRGDFTFTGLHGAEQIVGTFKAIIGASGKEGRSCRSIVAGFCATSELKHPSIFAEVKESGSYV